MPGTRDGATCDAYKGHPLSRLQTKTDAHELAQRADEAADLLRLLANENRLRILCHLIERDEESVNELATAVGLSQSALSQHLARLRRDNLVSTRRAGQTIYYSVPPSNALPLLKALKEIFC